MDYQFLIQLIISFFVGGSFIAFLSFLAEKASAKMAGIIIALPSTMAISLFFIGWTSSPQEVVKIIPMLPIAYGPVMAFTVIYLYLSKIKLKKSHSIILCGSISLLAWFILAIPIALFEFSNLLISFLSYLLIVGVGYYLLTVKNKAISEPSQINYSIWQKIGRAVFAGAIITLSVYLARTLGLFWGGIFSMFPAAFFATLVILHWQYNSNFLFRVWKNAPLGSIIFIIYAISIIFTFSNFGIVIGTILSYIISLFVFLIIKKGQNIFMGT